MSKISKSSERNTFQKSSYMDKINDPKKSEEEKINAQAMIEFYEQWDREELEQMQDPKWQKDNMEYDLLTTDWILEKVRESHIYAQHLYAAMCNREFIKYDIMTILKNQRWSCSWRHAGGIIADMRREGDYIDWYCSGIRGEKLPEEEFQKLTLEEQTLSKEYDAYVPESVVTDEIQKDLFRLGWVVQDEEVDID